MSPGVWGVVTFMSTGCMCHEYDLFTGDGMITRISTGTSGTVTSTVAS